MKKYLEYIKENINIKKFNVGDDVVFIFNDWTKHKGTVVKVTNNNTIIDFDEKWNNVLRDYVDGINKKGHYWEFNNTPDGLCYLEYYKQPLVKIDQNDIYGEEEWNE